MAATLAILWLVPLAGCPFDPGSKGDGATVYSLIAHLDEAVVEGSGAEREPVEPRMILSDGVERAAIVAHAPTTIQFAEVPIPPGAHLDLGIGTEDRRKAGKRGKVRFAVAVTDSSGKAEILWSRSLAPGEREEDRGWHDERIDLAPYAGSRLSISLRTEGRPDLMAAWSNPVVRSEEALPVLERGAVRRLVDPTDLLAGSRAIATLPDDGPTNAGASPGCVLRTRVKVPPDAVLSLAGQILHDHSSPSGPLGPVRIRVGIDGQDVFRRDLTTARGIMTFDERLPLGDFSGREVDLEFEMCDVGAGNTLVLSKRLWLSRMEAVPRLPRGDGPNLLLVLVDTLRADQLGLYGYDRPTSPFLDSLAAESLVFERALSASSWTLPSVASLLTGSSPVKHRVVEWIPLAQDFETLGERLQGAGFTTFGISANPLVGRLEGFDQGFETFIQIPWARAENINRIFLDWLAENRGQRWFAYLHFVDPHSPYDAPGSFRNHFTGTGDRRLADDDALEALANSVNTGSERIPFDDGDIEYLRARYDGETLYWDSQFRELLGELEARGVLEDTVVIITSDHGEEFLEHGKLMHGYHLYDETIRVPLVIRAPGRVRSQRVSRQVEVRGVIGAALELMGFPATDPPLPNVLATARGEEEPVVFSYTNEADTPEYASSILASAGDSRWKYILRPADGVAEIYDLLGDPGEYVNLIGDRPELHAQYDEILTDWLGRAQLSTEPTSKLDERSRERLRALGYIR